MRGQTEAELQTTFEEGILSSEMTEKAVLSMDNLIGEN